MARLLECERFEEQAMVRKIAFILTVVYGLSAFAQEPQISVFTFQGWKEQQILDAQNQTLRISARIAQLKTGKTPGAKNSAPLPANSRFKKAESDSVAAAEKDLRRSQESLKAANDLSVEDYVSVYLPSLRENPEALQTLAQKLSKEELAEIFKVLLRKDNPSDTKRNEAALADALTPITRSHVP
jgi:C4-dicarboxylate-specific signal transduction histidine kinase